MCDSCDVNNKADSFEGGEGCYFDKKDNRWYFVINHFRNEINRVKVNFCPECGRDLKIK